MSGAVALAVVPIVASLILAAFYLAAPEGGWWS